MRAILACGEREIGSCAPRWEAWCYAGVSCSSLAVGVEWLLLLLLMRGMLI